MFKAECVVAYIAHKVHMVIVVVASRTIFAAQGIPYRIIGCGYGMDDAFFHKSLQGAVNGYPVKLLTTQAFNISMRQSPAGMVKKLQYFFAATSYA
jgi:hypothetical protein